MNSNSCTAQQLARQLSEAGLRLVLAESCTAGLVAASLAAIPGVSNNLCGSFVVYRNDSKFRWLGIDSQLLDDPTVGPVSAQVTKSLALAALNSTPEADVAAAVTGHLGPGSPPALDGIVFYCLVFRNHSKMFERTKHLTCPAPVDSGDIEERSARLSEAAEWVLLEIAADLANLGVSKNE